MTERRDLVGSARPAAVDADIVMFLRGPDGEFIDDGPEGRPPRSMADLPSVLRESMRAERADLARGRQPLEPRPVTGSPSKPCFPAEIVVISRSSPARAASAAVQGAFLQPPDDRPGISVDS